MLNTTFDFKGMQIKFNGQTFVVDSAGIRNDEPYAAVEPPNEDVSSAIVACIHSMMPHPPSQEQIQVELDRLFN